MRDNRWFWLTDIKQWLEPFCPLGLICLWCQSLPVPCFQLSPTWTSIRRLSWWGQSAMSHLWCIFPHPTNNAMCPLFLCNIKATFCFSFYQRERRTPDSSWKQRVKSPSKKYVFFFFHFSTANTMYLVLAVGTWYFFSLILFLVTKFE